jgi:hypothetical protein
VTRQIQALHRISAANCESVDHLRRRGFVQQGTDWQRDFGSTHSPAASDARRSYRNRRLNLKPASRESQRVRRGRVWRPGSATHMRGSVVEWFRVRFTAETSVSTAADWIRNRVCCHLPNAGACELHLGLTVSRIRGGRPARSGPD